MVLCNNIPRESDQISSVLAEFNPLINDEHLYDTKSSTSRIGKCMMAIGSTHCNNTKYLLDNYHAPNGDSAPIKNHPVGDQVVPQFDDVSNKDIDKTQDSCNMQSYLDLLEPHDKLIINDIDLDDIMVSAFHGGRHEGTKPSDFATLWRIDAYSASKTIDITSQNYVRKDNPHLSSQLWY